MLMQMSAQNDGGTHALVQYSWINEDVNIHIYCVTIENMLWWTRGSDVTLAGRTPRLRLSH